MNRRIKTILAIGVPALLIGAYFIVTNMVQSKEEQAQEQREVITIFDFKKADVEQVSVTKSGKTITLIPQNGAWVPAEDIRFELKQAEVNAVGNTAISLAAQRIIEEQAENLTKYRLDDPRAVVNIRTKDGKTYSGLIGAKTPQGTAYYVKKKSEDTVYTVPTYFADNINVTVNDLREPVVAYVEPKELIYLRVEAEHTIEISTITEEDTLEFFLSRLKMTEPYRNPQDIDTQAYSEYLEKLPTTVKAVSFIEEDPESLEPYGLFKPRVKLQLQSREGGFTLLLGDKRDEGEVYATLMSHPRVFTVAMESLEFLTTEPFTLISKFALIINIDMVDRVTFGTPDREHVMEIDRTKGAEAENGGDNGKEETGYKLNGEVVEEGPFKKLYQKVIGLIIDAPNPEPDYNGPPAGREPALTVSYTLNGPPGHASIRLYPFNTDFYALYRGAVSEFLIAKEQVETLMETAAAFPEIE